MLYLYLHKAVGPVPADSVERFAPEKAAVLIREGVAEEYTEKKHGQKPGAPRLGRIKPIKQYVTKG